MFASVAYAQDAAAPIAEPSPIAGLLPILLMVVLFYFLLIRPQQKKMSDHKKMVIALRRGDKVLTNGGIFGTIAKVEDDLFEVEIAPEVRVKVEKNSVSTVITRSEPADAALSEATKPAKTKSAAGKGKVKAND